jgi:hypothetical protein
VADADVTSAFWIDTMCRTLVQELTRDQPNTTKELLDIATRHASGEEAVGAAFVLGNGKMAPCSSPVAPSKATIKGDKGSKKG